MGFLDKAKEAAEQARQAASGAVDQARGATQASDEPSAQAVAEQPHAPGRGLEDLKAQMKKTVKLGKDSIATLVEKIDPGVLADLIIKATAAQEKANIALREKGSPYRIAEISITATIPPQMGFSVVRMGELDELDDPSSLHLLEKGVVDTDEPVLSLGGDNPIEEIGP